MAVNLIDRDLALAAPGRAQGREFRRIFAASFLIFLIVALIARVLPQQWRPYPLRQAGGSIVDEARAAANTFIPFVFMG